MFHKGDRVRVDFGRRKLTGVVVQDRGAIGAQGRHFFQVDIPMDPFEPMSMELPEDEMEPIEPEAEATPPATTEQIVAYLVNGGLVSILRANLSGGKNQPRVWLCFDQLGNVTHTFVPERGIVGGSVVPFSAVHDGKIFTAKKDAVLTFLGSFGLNHQVCLGVISDVGTSP